MKPQRSLIALVLLAAAESSVAVESFTAVCFDARTEGYRREIGIDGGQLADGWSENERFGGKWLFEYKGGPEALVDGKPAEVLGSTEDVLVIASVAKSSSAVSAWTYVIHTKLEAIAASQVNGHSSLGAGVKARSVQLKCEFTEAVR